MKTPVKNDSLLSEFQEFHEIIGFNEVTLEALSSHSLERQKEIYRALKEMVEDDLIMILTMIKMQEELQKEGESK